MGKFFLQDEEYLNNKITELEISLSKCTDSEKQKIILKDIKFYQQYLDDLKN